MKYVLPAVLMFVVLLSPAFFLPGVLVAHAAADQGSDGTTLKGSDTGSDGTITKGGSKDTGPSIGLINPLGSSNCSQNQTCLIDFLLKLLDLVIRIGTIVVIVMLVYIGFKYVMAQGSASALAQVHNQLLWTIIGALVLLGSKAIALGIQATVQALSVGQ
jgi:hypothetical protein